jgi:hypothetical protein
MALRTCSLECTPDPGIDIDLFKWKGRKSQSQQIVVKTRMCIPGKIRSYRSSLLTNYVPPPNPDDGSISETTSMKLLAWTSGCSP